MVYHNNFMVFLSWLFFRKVMDFHRFSPIFKPIVIVRKIPQENPSPPISSTETKVLCFNLTKLLDQGLLVFEMEIHVILPWKATKMTGYWKKWKNLYLFILKKTENPRTWTWVEEQVSQVVMIWIPETVGRLVGCQPSLPWSCGASEVCSSSIRYPQDQEMVICCEDFDSGPKLKRKIDWFFLKVLPRTKRCFLKKAGKASSIVSLAHEPSMLRAKALSLDKRFLPCFSRFMFFFGRHSNFPYLFITIISLFISIYIHLIFWDIRELSGTT